MKCSCGETELGSASADRETSPFTLGGVTHSLSICGTPAALERDRAAAGQTHTCTAEEREILDAIGVRFAEIQTRDAVVAAAIAETDAEMAATRAHSNAWEAPHGSPALKHADDASRAVAAARTTRRAAVAALIVAKARHEP